MVHYAHIGIRSENQTGQVPLFLSVGVGAGWEEKRDVVSIELVKKNVFAPSYPHTGRKVLILSLAHYYLPK